MIKTFVLTFLISTIIFSQANTTMLKLPSLFSDNMVLQQKTGAAVWGTAAANKTVTVKGSWGGSVTVRSGSDGAWKAKIKTPGAGGPYELTVSCGNENIVFKNVLIGEVWLCSGQSNMEMPLEGWPPNDTIHGGADEIRKADHPNIRLFSVEHKISSSVEKEFNGTWTVCTPANIASFSAAAFFFGKKLMTELNVPVGLIQSTWSGTPAEAWTGAAALSKLPEYKDVAANLRNCLREQESLNKWLDQFRKIDLDVMADQNVWRDIDLGDQDLSKTDFSDSDWPEVRMPDTWENIGLQNYDGVIWYRKQIEIPESWRGKELVLNLGPIDDMDATYINGTKIGGFEKTGFWFEQRNYKVPAEAVTGKSLTIAVRVIDYYLGGGMYAKPEDFYIQLNETKEKLSIAGNWKYFPVGECRNSRLYVFPADKFVFNSRPGVSIDLSPLAPAMIYNAQIAPLAPYNLRGAIWYQGESNTVNPELYRRLFPAMIKNWRDDWNDRFSFYYTQIAPFYYATGTNSQYLREAQFLSLSVPKSGMAVTIDIGNTGNIHPGNKRDVGERLALWALAKDYGKKVVYSGPLYKSAKTVKAEMHLSFDHSDGLRITEIKSKNNFQIAGEDRIFYDANVSVVKNKLIVSSPKVADPKAVRYCWGDLTEGTLFNGAGLPASSFRTDDWK